MRYKNEIAFLHEHETKTEENKRLKWSSNQLRTFLKKYPSAPKDYRDYMLEIGPGPFREFQFLVHDGLFLLSELVEGLNPTYTENVLIFGHNFSGDLSGFLLPKWEVSEFLHETDELYVYPISFHTYIRQMMLIGTDGKDERIYRRTHDA